MIAARFVNNFTRACSAASACSENWVRSSKVGRPIVLQDAQSRAASACSEN